MTVPATAWCLLQIMSQYCAFRLCNATSQTSVLTRFRCGGRSVRYGGCFVLLLWAKGLIFLMALRPVWRGRT